MRSTESIWLNEYEGLIPQQPRTGAAGHHHQADSRNQRPAQPVSPHFELAWVQPKKVTPLAFFE